VEARAARLIVTSTDDCGNVSTCVTELCVPEPDDDDHDHDDDDGHDDDDDRDHRALTPQKAQLLEEELRQDR
jgi:hypothetical protein